MKRVAIVQARMTSTRLPGKVLMDLDGRPMLAQELRRLRACRSVDEIAIATTTNPNDEPLIALAEREEVRWFRGSEQDVLARYVGAAREAGADVVIRVTSDCPLLDPEVTDRVVDALTGCPMGTREAGLCDYASNIQERTYPRGLDVEALFWDTLLRIDRLGTSVMAREHVTVFLRAEHPELFLVRSVKDSEDNSDLRWTVDTEVDLRLVRLLYAALGVGERAVPYRQLLEYVRARPELARMNEGIETWTPTLQPAS